MKVPRPIDPGRPRRRRGRALVAAALSTLMAGAVVAPSLLADPASAAGSGVLDVEISPFDLATGNPITDITNGSNGSTPTNQISYRVGYSCGTATCEDVEIQLGTTPPAAANPVQNMPAESFFTWTSWVQPPAGGTITGDDVTGKVVHLGDLAPGTSATFSVTYTFAGVRNREIPPAAWFADGAQIPMSATISSPTATAPVTDSADVTWHIKTPTGPQLAIAPGGSTLKPDVPVAIRFGMNPGNMTSSNGIMQGSASFVPAGSYQVVAHLPVEATIVSTDFDGVIDNAAHTVTWTKGTPDHPSYGARGGWSTVTGSTTTGINNGLVPDGDAFWQQRTVNVVFPVSAFPEADASGCNFSHTVTTTADVTVSYLDAAGTVRSTSLSRDTAVACATPFGGMPAPSKVIVAGATSPSSNGDGIVSGTGPATVLAVNVPAPGETDTRARAWRVSATSAGNVAATAVIDEPNLSQDHIRVDRITANQYAGAPAGWEATVEWVDNTGDHGTAHLGNGQFIDAASGRWFVSAKATAPIAAARILRTDGSSLTVSMDYRFKVDDGAVPLVGQQRTNTADVSVTYPADADGDGVDDAYTDTAGQPLPTRSFAAQVSRTVQYTEPLGQLNPGFAGISVDGGGQLFPGTNATFTMRATTANVWPGTSIQPQLVFVAPVGWHVIPGSAAISANGTGWAASPASPSFAYATKTIAGTDREVVVATWPSAVSLSSTVNEQWPTLSVKATPTNTAPVGVNTIAQVWAGDQSGAWSDGTTGFFRQNAHQFNGDTIAVDATDVDGDGNVAEDYSANVNANGLIVAATDSVSAIKELCVPDPSAADGCQWVSDPAHPGEVLVNASALTYRIRIVNSGNTDLTGVVAYDVLPHVGDTGLLPGGAPRGSQFALTLGGIDASTGVIVAGSSSTNPARPEVNPTASGTVDDWGPVATGDRALRLTVDGSLAPAAERTVVFHAAVASGVTPGQQACNSAAVDSDATLPAEPAPVCVTLKALPNPPPTAAISSPTDGASYDNGTAVTADFTCADTDLASCLAVDEHGDPVAQGAAIDTTTPGSHSLTVVAIDSIGQMDTASVSYTVKVKPNVPPTASITTPANGAVYFQGQKVPAAYTCADPDGTVASCVGTVAVGSDVDTATLGSKTFTVTATDDQGATGAATTTYTVVATKGVCRGTALGLTAVALPISLGVANGPTSPCATDLNQVAKVNVIVITPGIPLLGIAPNQVTVGALKGASQSGPGSAAAQAEVASVKIQLLGQTVEATGLTSSAASVLSSCAAPAAASGLSSILTLTINGKPVANLHQSITVPLVVGALALNEHAVVGGGVSQTALHLDVLGLVDLALGQSVAGATC